MYKTKYLIALIVMVCNLGYAQPDSLWSRTFGGPNNDEGVFVFETPTGFLLGGTVWNASTSDVRVIRTDAAGNILSSDFYGSPSEEQCYSAIKTSDGGFLLFGSVSESPGSSYTDGWMMKINSNGDSIWTKTHHFGPRSDAFLGAQQLTDNGFIIVGSTYTEWAGYEGWMIKTNEYGDSLWSTVKGGEESDLFVDVLSASDTVYLLLGQTTSFGAGGADYWILKMDHRDSVYWEHTYGGAQEEYAMAMAQTTDGGLLLTGHTNSFGSHTDYDVLALRTDHTGDSLWAHRVGDEGYEFGLDVIEASDGSIVLLSATSSNSAGGQDALLTKLLPEGGEAWNMRMGGPDGDMLKCVQQTSDDDYVMCGRTESYGSGEGDIWLYRAGNEGIYGAALWPGSVFRSILLRWRAPRQGYCTIYSTAYAYTPFNPQDQRWQFEEMIPIPSPGPYSWLHLDAWDGQNDIEQRYYYIMFATQ